jgi:hypothetical protein
MFREAQKRMAKFLHVGFSFDGEIKIDQLKPIFDTALDWYRYAPNCWIVWSTKTPEQWYEVLKPHLVEGKDTVLICELNMDSRYGALKKGGWDWLQKPR